MKDRQQPSDEEIQGYMNFNRLLDDRKAALKAARTTTILTWGLPVLVSIIGIIGLLWMNSTDTSLGAESRSQEIATNQKRNSPDLPLDSAVEKPESARIEPPKPNSERSPAPSAKHEKPTDEASSKEEDKPETAESGYIQAEPVQGYAELYEYFNANLVYPEEALKDSIQGVQTISFVINTQGMPEQIEIVKSLGPSFEKECKRLIENMPAWKPARLNGKPVPSKISLPLTFQIQKIKN